jgi:hypothetical protein
MLIGIVPRVDLPRASLISAAYDAAIQYPGSIGPVQKESRETNLYVAVVLRLRKNALLPVPGSDR